MSSASIELPVDLEMRIEPGHDAMVLYCGGQIISGESCRTFRAAVVDLLSQHPNIIVDLGEVHCMDRQGLEALVSLYSTARTARAKVRFVNLTIEVSDSRHRGHQLHKLAS